MLSLYQSFIELDIFRLFRTHKMEDTDQIGVFKAFNEYGEYMAKVSVKTFCDVA